MPPSERPPAAAERPGGRSGLPGAWRWRRRGLWRSTGLAASALCLLGTTLGVVSSSPGTAAASIGSDRTKVAQLEQLIAREGDLVQSLVSRYNQVEEHLMAVEKWIADDRRHLAADRRAEAGAALRLRSLAIDAYVDASSGGSGSLLASGNATTAAEQQVYLGVASQSLDEAVATLEVDQHATAVAESSLRLEEASLAQTLRQLLSAREAAQEAIVRDEAMLRQVKGNLLALVTAANEAREAAEERAQEEREAQEQAQLASDAPPPPAPAPAPTGGSYANPLRAIGGLTPERVDQGVDYGGYGPIYAIGDGVVLNTVNAGWPGGTFIAYQLTDGPASGLVVYAAEDIDPEVSIGQSVTPNTVLGQMYEGPDGIETGWADPSALGESMAAAYGQFSGANSTAFGYNFSQLLESVGAPGGILQNDPPTGSLPSGWPQW